MLHVQTETCHNCFLHSGNDGKAAASKIDLSVITIWSKFDHRCLGAGVTFSATALHKAKHLTVQS